VRTWQALRFNQVVLGFRDGAHAVRSTRDPRLTELTALMERDLSGPVAPSERPWTDDRAPVEWITDRMIVAFAARGGELDEVLLPTAP